MADPENAQQTPLGLYEKPQRAGVTAIEVIAVLLSLLWLGAAVLYFVFVPGIETDVTFNSLQFIITLLAIFKPVAMIWVAATAARSSRVMREESARLQLAIDGIRQAYVAQQQQKGPSGTEPSVARKLDEIAETARKTETALATFSTVRR